MIDEAVIILGLGVLTIFLPLIVGLLCSGNKEYRGTRSSIDLSGLGKMQKIGDTPIHTPFELPHVEEKAPKDDHFIEKVLTFEALHHIWK